MSALAPNLFDRRFQDFVEVGRARLRSLAPDWTDYNAHDPGITLMELLAWTAEAQLYSLGRLRRDERVAYAALLGLKPSGTHGASGVLWRDRTDPGAPAATLAHTQVIPTDATINVLGSVDPTFRPTDRLLWVPGAIERLALRAATDSTVDFTTINDRGGPAFLPFGEQPGRRDVLSMKFRTRDEAGLFGVRREEARGARWAIGVRAAPQLSVPSTQPTDAPRSKGTRPSRLDATLVNGDVRVPIAIVRDSSLGLLQTGILLLDLDNAPDSPAVFTIELRAPNGFPRAPRLLRLEPNVIPILQGRTITSEFQIATGFPDWSFELGVPGLRFDAGQHPLRSLTVGEPDGVKTWTPCDRLSGAGPQDRVYQLDSLSGRVTFGNGVNGRIPPAAAQVLVTYDVSDGADGNVARNRSWQVTGFPGAFGVNLDPIAGGADPSDGNDQRREARRRSRDEHALVSSHDVVAAAESLPLLEVARAWVVAPDAKTPRTRVVKLVAMRSRATEGEPAQIPETRRWLDTIRRRLVRRMPLGTRLSVVAPRYVEFSIRASVEVSTGRDPGKVGTGIATRLQKRLLLVPAADGTPAREPGVPVSGRDVVAWIRLLDGVSRVASLQLVLDDGTTTDEVKVLPSGLPRYIASPKSITVTRSGQRSTP
ncbi:MAG: putative baseplate assembly protein [Acidobacteriota bacterium]|nr:putative baseplate assembly protein [Acidobacteriota bacterium]